MDKVTSGALALAVARLEDMLQGDDGQAWKEARKALPELRAALDLQAADSAFLIAKVVQSAVNRVLATQIVEGESPERLRAAIAKRVSDIAEDTFVFTPESPTDSDVIEQWRFDLRQAILDYSSATRKNDAAAIKESTMRGVALIDLVTHIAMPQGPNSEAPAK